MNDILDIIKKNGVTTYDLGNIKITYKGIVSDSVYGEHEIYTIERCIYKPPNKDNR